MQAANVEIRVEEQRPATSCQSPGEVSCDEPTSDCTSTSRMLAVASECGRASDDLSMTSSEMATLPTQVAHRDVDGCSEYYEHCDEQLRATETGNSSIA